MRSIKRGDIFWADLGYQVGSEQCWKRPVLIIQNDVGNHYSPTVICAPLTAAIHKKDDTLPTHVFITASGSLQKDSVVMLEQIRTVDKNRIDKKVCKLDEETMEKIDKALRISLGLDKEWRT